MERKGKNGDWWLLALAAEQHGLVTRKQLFSRGMGASAIAGRLATGRLHSIHTGVYAVGLPELTEPGRFMAAVLAGGPGALLSHGAAARHWRLLNHRGKPEVMVPTYRRRRPGIAFHQWALHDEDRHLLEGTPVTSVPLTLLAVAAEGNEPRFERAYEAAERKDLLDGRAIDRLLARHPRRAGSKLLRAARGAETLPAWTRSELERRFLRFCEEHGLPQPSVNASIVGHEVDMLWREQRLVAELDGFEHHRTRQAFERDRDRDTELLLAGYRVIRVTWSKLTDRSAKLATDLHGLLG